VPGSGQHSTSQHSAACGHDRRPDTYLVPHACTRLLLRFLHLPVRPTHLPSLHTSSLSTSSRLTTPPAHCTAEAPACIQSCYIYRFPLLLPCLALPFCLSSAPLYISSKHRCIPSHFPPIHRPPLHCLAQCPTTYLPPQRTTASPMRHSRLSRPRSRPRTHYCLRWCCPSYQLDITSQEPSSEL
jgi:hypothetical protein